MVGTASEPPPIVVSPPSAPNLNSLLTGHGGQEGATLLTTQTTMTPTATDTQADNTDKSPKKKKSKKLSPAKRMNPPSTTAVAPSSNNALLP
jgi:hypothetical protein